MKVASTNHTVITVELSRRNLETLLAKLDDVGSMNSIYKAADDMEGGVFVVAVDDSEHYGDRKPGAMILKGEWV